MDKPYNYVNKNYDREMRNAGAVDPGTRYLACVSDSVTRQPPDPMFREKGVAGPGLAKS